jgi:hypothetical protein
MLSRQSDSRCVSDMRLPEGNYSLHAGRCDKNAGGERRKNAEIKAAESGTCYAPVGRDLDPVADAQSGQVAGHGLLCAVVHANDQARHVGTS